MPSAPPTVFISYSHRDERWKDLLSTHLGVLEAEGRLVFWDDRKLRAGDDWYSELSRAMESARVAVMLISAYFLTSDFIRNKELPRLLERREKEGMALVPIIVRSCAWQHVRWLAQIQIRPLDGRPLASRKGDPLDQTLAAIATEILKLAHDKPYSGTPDVATVVPPVTSAATEARNLADWFARVEDEHRRLADHFERPVGLEDLEKAWVRLDVTLSSKAESSGTDRLELRSLDGFLKLDREEHAWVTRRWLVEGDPGSGKTTLLRHLAGRLAKRRNRESIPVFISLPRLLEPFRQPLDYLRSEYGLPSGQRLTDVLDQAGREGRLVILLDGVDEVPPERRDRVRRLLDWLGHDWRASSVVVTSRPIGLGKLPPRYKKLLLQPFDEEQRRRFLRKWFYFRLKAKGVAEAERAAAHFDSERSLRLLSHNPLHLTLLTVLWEKGVKAPTRRSELYDAIFDLLLEGRHKDPPVAIPAAADVREALGYLAFDFTSDDRMSEEPAGIERRLLADEIDTARRRLAKIWGKNLRAFLEDVYERTYILGPHDGPRAPWRFWHRTFREALTAERLEADHNERGEEYVLEKVEAIAGDLSRWAEPFALLAGRLADPEKLVSRLAEMNHSLGLRALATAQGVKEDTLRRILGLTAYWQGRSEVFQSIPEQLDESESCLALVDRLRRDTKNGNDLFFLYWAAEETKRRWPACAQRADDLLERFFSHFPTPVDIEIFQSLDVPRDGPIKLWCKISAGEGWVGSGPRPLSVLTSFFVAAVPVTNAQFAVFDPDHANLKRADHPVVDVTWYEAVTFCRWLAAKVPGCEGARLPTEEEWEYACRAGSRTQYCNGDGEEALVKVGWYVENSVGETHPVGQKPANRRGLYDMHGNIDEWTISAWESSRISEREPGSVLEVNPANERGDGGADAGAKRVIRGGSVRSGSIRARSAARYWRQPDLRVDDMGFRVVVPSTS